MKRFLKAQAFLAIVLIALLFCPLGCKKEQPQAKEIKIGAVMPLTGEGAVYGVPQKNAAELAAEEINSKGGLLGKKVVIFAQDDKALPSEAVSVARVFVSSNDVVGVIGHPNSGCAIPASKIYNQHNLPYVVTSATNPAITQQGFRNVFRFAPTDDMQGVSAAEFIFSDLGTKALVVIHDNEAYGKGLASRVVEHFKSLGGRVPMSEAIMASENDYKSVLGKAAEHQPEVIFYGGMVPQGAILIRQAKELGFQTKFVFGDGCFDERLKELAGTDCRNVYVSFLAPPWDSMPSSKEFTRKFQENYGSVPAFAPYGYDAVMVLAEAIKKANSSVYSKMIEALHDPGFVVNGVTGEIRFGQDGQAPNRHFYFYTFDTQGKLVLYK